ncbi:MAG: TonB family protein [Saprospiraceae bacterium]|nr:TonB family protein [Saprospiraceae bacterium]
MQPGQRNSHIEQLLRKLRTGSLTESEWAELRDAAASDPFLQDALEGLSAVPADTRVEHLQTLARRIEAAGNNKSRRLVAFPRIAAAAAVMLLLVGAWVVWQNSTTQTTTVALKQEDQYHDDDPDASKPLYTTDHPELVDTGDDDGEADDEKQVSPAPQTELAIRQPENGQNPPDKPLVILDGVSVADESTPVANHAAGQEMTPPASSAEPRTSIAARQASDDQDRAREELPSMAPSPDQRITHTSQITGIVQDNTGEPLIGANIQIKGTRHNAISDVAGNFMLELPAEAVPAPGAATLVVSYVGYEPVEALAGPGDSLVLQLNQQIASLSEVQVTGYQTGTRKQSERSAARALAQPVDGQRQYQRYLRRNLQMPEAARAGGISGTVVLEFKILPDGRPDSIIVVESLGYGCDAEAIRLIQEGPDWDYANAQVPVGRVSVKF